MDSHRLKFVKTNNADPTMCILVRLRVPMGYRTVQQHVLQLVRVGFLFLVLAAALANADKKKQRLRPATKIGRMLPMIFIN